MNRATSSITLDGEEAAVLPDGRFFADADLSPGNNELPLVVEETDGTITNKTLQVQITDGERLLHEYDLNGNLIKTDRWDTATNSSLPHRQYSWDAVNRLLSITRYEGANELRTEFGYNIANQRVERKEYTNTAQTEHVRYIWDGFRVRQRRDASGAVVQITYCGNGELDVSAGGLKRFYTRDHLSSVRNVMDTSGNEIASYDYSPFGMRETISGTYETEIGYTGHHYHIGSGLVLTLYRAYDPVTGRWLSADPLGEAGGVNLYAYVYNNPINLIDPDGRIPLFALVIVAAVTGAAEAYVAPLADRAGAYITLSQAGALDLYDPNAGPAFDHGAAGKQAGTNAALALAGPAAKGIQCLGRIVKSCRIAPKKGGDVTVYRAFGGDSRAQGSSWTTTDPRTVTNFRDKAGLPSGGASGVNNTADFLIQGKVDPANIIKSRPALPLDGNKGGLPELIIDPKNVKLDDFSVLKP